MTVRNTVTGDARVRREAELLAARGFRVVVFGLARDGFPREEVRNGVRVVRLAPRSAALAVADAPIRGPRYAERIWLRFVRRRRMLLARVAGRAQASGKPEPGSPEDLAVRRPAGARALRWLWTTDRKLLERTRARLRAWAYIRTASEALATVRPDVIHCHDFNTLWAGVRAGRRTGVPVIYDAHEAYAHQALGGTARRRRWFVEAVERRALEHVSAVITVSDSIADHMAARLRIARPTVVLNVAIPPAASVPGRIPEPFASDAVKLLYLGGVTVARGLEQAIDALTYLPGTILVALGPVVRPEFGDLFRQRAAATGVADRFFLIPPVDPAEVNALAAHATIGLSLPRNVSLNNYFSLPNKLFEYLQAGLPVVASDFPELRRVVVGCDVGRVCDPEDPASIAQAVRSIIDNPGELERLRRNTKDAAVRYSWEREREKLVSLYAGLGFPPRE